MQTPENEAEMGRYLLNLSKTLSHGDTTSENPPPYAEPTKASIAIAEEDGRQAIRYVRQHAPECHSILVASVLWDSLREAVL